MFDDHDRQLAQASRSSTHNSGNPEHMNDKYSAIAAGTPLSLAHEQDLLIITAIYGGRHYRRQLMDMGLRPGLQIKVIRAGGRGPMLITVGETRLAIGRGMVEKILATPVSLDVSALGERSR